MYWVAQLLGVDKLPGGKLQGMALQGKAGQQAPVCEPPASRLPGQVSRSGRQSKPKRERTRNGPEVLVSNQCPD
jgi:hypothetical protein